jgi:hypothetical protein
MSAFNWVIRRSQRPSGTGTWGRLILVPRFVVPDFRPVAIGVAILVRPSNLMGDNLRR